MSTSTSVDSLKIHVLTKAQYDEIQNPSDTELYLVPDTIDSSPTSGSGNPVSSGGVYTALSGKADSSSLTNYIQKSNTSGLVKNDGTIDTNTYLTSVPVTSVNGQTGAVILSIPDDSTLIHYDEYGDVIETDLSIYQVYIEATSGVVIPGGILTIGADDSSTPAKLVVGLDAGGTPLGGWEQIINQASGTDVTLQDELDTKEDKVTIESASGATLTAQVGKYYTLSSVGTLAITLPTIASGTTKVQTVTFYIAAGSSPAVTFTSTHSIYYSDGFEIAADSTYEVSAAYNGIAWVVASVKIVIPT